MTDIIDTDIVAALRNAAVPSDAMFNACINLQHVADHIRAAVGAPFRPTWAGPTTLAKELSARDSALLCTAADAIERLEFDQREMLRAVLRHFGPEGEKLVRADVLAARQMRKTTQ